MVKVFKTDIETPKEAKIIIDQLLELHPNGRITVDLEDCDRVLKVETNRTTDTNIIDLVRSEGYDCEVLP